MASVAEPGALAADPGVAGAEQLIHRTAPDTLAADSSMISAAERDQKTACMPPQIRNKATFRHCKYKIFQTLNHACVTWDSKAKPKDLLGGHINIRSIMPKCDQIQHLLNESNIDYLYITESWLHAHSPTAGLRPRTSG